MLEVRDGQVSEAYVGNTAAGEAGFSGVAVDADGMVVFGTGAVARLDGPNTATLLIDRRQYSLTLNTSLALGPDGELYAGLPDDHRLYRIDGGAPSPSRAPVHPWQ